MADNSVFHDIVDRVEKKDAEGEKDERGERLFVNLVVLVVVGMVQELVTILAQVVVVKTIQQPGQLGLGIASHRGVDRFQHVPKIELFAAGREVEGKLTNHPHVARAQIDQVFGVV